MRQSKTAPVVNSRDARRPIVNRVTCPVADHERNAGLQEPSGAASPRWLLLLAR